MRRYGAVGRRDANEPEIVDELRAIGATVKKLHEPADLLVGFRGENHLLEVKLPKGPRGGDRSRSHGRRDKRQEEMRAMWRGRIQVVRSPREALLAVGAIR